MEYVHYETVIFYSTGPWSSLLLDTIGPNWPKKLDDANNQGTQRMFKSLNSCFRWVTHKRYDQD
jgi:hypothetical protein